PTHQRFGPSCALFSDSARPTTARLGVAPPGRHQRSGELAEQAAQVFFPQTSHPTDTTYQKDESSEDSEPLNSPFTMLELGARLAAR
ncbi:hypothetical protein MTO96_041248, partial [Rhipicephalus appendiculatus]